MKTESVIQDVADRDAERWDLRKDSIDFHKKKGFMVDYEFWMLPSFSMLSPIFRHSENGFDSVWQVRTGHL